MNRKRLWEVDHPYYCSETNYFSNDCSAHYLRWQDFVSEQGDADLDMNLIFRFDWKAPHVDGDPDGAIEWMGDENYRDSTLLLFYIGQRKGLFRTVEIDVCRADEPKIYEWLKSRWQHMQLLWEPFAEQNPIDDAPEETEPITREWWYSCCCVETTAVWIDDDWCIAWNQFLGVSLVSEEGGKLPLPHIQTRGQLQELRRVLGVQS